MYIWHVMFIQMLFIICKLNTNLIILICCVNVYTINDYNQEFSQLMTDLLERIVSR